ncbi:MAG: type IV secretory system conjugative DNA transfer family protein, partial [Candidatus Pacebacteria bacterium]|nr:type IV secretory system conjugative DNA transfer family protein [Candidatus Paceibacterota bacterium]
KERAIDDIAVEQIKKKLESQIVETNIRDIASAVNRKDAEMILAEIESAFNQFANAQGNHFVWNHIDGSKLFELEKDFSFRNFSRDIKIPLNLRELTSILHFPQKVDTAPELRQAKAGTAPAPVGLPEIGTLLGINKNRNTERKVFMTAEDRLRHMYVIGQTGTGKTTLLKNMITQDILAGEGVCFIDPHGSDIQDILSIIPKSRFEDVIYFDPASIERPMALNMLEYDRNYPEQKTFVVNELFSIFQKLYGANPESMGPMFEQYFRNATMLVIEDPESGSTLLEVSRVMANKAFRDLKISRCKNPVVVQFWKEVAEKAGGEASLANIVPYITSKFDVFLANEIMRPIIAQEKSSFNFRDVMDNKKILLVNLSKGRLGDINANLIGLILVGKILMAALSRVDSFGKTLPNFYLYIDEFQNITTNSIAQILSEARKYKLSLNVAHQFIAQLEDDIKDAVFGNVGSIATFRVGAEDAEYLVKQFEPVFTQRDIMNLDNHNAYLKLLSGGRPLKPFNIETLPPPKGHLDIVAKLKELSYLKFGRPREEVEAEVMKKYAKAPVPAPAPASI